MTTFCFAEIDFWIRGGSCFGPPVKIDSVEIHHVFHPRQYNSLILKIFN